MREIIDPVLQGGSLQLAFWAGLAGTALLLLFGLTRRVKAGSGRRSRRAARTPNAPAPVDTATRLRVQSAYAVQSAPTAANSPSSAPVLLPMTSGAAPVSPSCPAELSRRIDRLEAKVRARRAGSHG
jgi:hypothetical protein